MGGLNSRESRIVSVFFVPELCGFSSWPELWDSSSTTPMTASPSTFPIPRMSTLRSTISQKSNSHLLHSAIKIHSGISSECSVIEDCVVSVDLFGDQHDTDFQISFRLTAAADKNWYTIVSALAAAEEEKTDADSA